MRHRGPAPAAATGFANGARSSGGSGRHFGRHGAAVNVGAGAGRGSRRGRRDGRRAAPCHAPPVGASIGAQLRAGEGAQGRASRRTVSGLHDARQRRGRLGGGGGEGGLPGLLRPTRLRGPDTLRARGGPVRRVQPPPPLPRLKTPILHLCPSQRALGLLTPGWAWCRWCERWRGCSGRLRPSLCHAGGRCGGTQSALGCAAGRRLRASSAYIRCWAGCGVWEAWARSIALGGRRRWSTPRAPRAPCTLGPRGCWRAATSRLSTWPLPATCLHLFPGVRA